MADADDLTRLALNFPGATQYPHFDRTAFKARVTFATLAPDRLSANLKLAPDEQALKCAVAPEAFSALPSAWGARGWTLARLAALSEAELQAALALAYAHAAPRPTRKLGLTAARRLR
jgi:hypothetical protein